MAHDRSLTGKRMVITGAGRGLGRALAIVAADQGAELVLLGRSVAALQEVAGAIATRTGRAAAVVPCDLASPDGVREACRAVLAANPAIDVLINNGAPWLPGDLMSADEAEIVATVSGAVAGTILVTKGLLPGLMKSTAADIMTIVSTAGWTGWDVGGASASPFHAAKHGQSGFSDALRHELKDKGIRVMAIYPPDFDDVDPLDPAWDTTRAPRAKLSNREVVETILFALTAPRACTYPVIILDNMPA
ncbi:MAG TPA: SDR family NAD(P)-dependent oxidoreductase [Dongiaceae bacterium]|nr:SDR family NAD(P)-dependent oxidoreductase [Dongiaceae bacterium]